LTLLKLEREFTCQYILSWIMSRKIVGLLFDRGWELWLRKGDNFSVGVCGVRLVTCWCLIPWLSRARSSRSGRWIGWTGHKKTCNKNNRTNLFYPLPGY